MKTLFMNSLVLSLIMSFTSFSQAQVDSSSVVAEESPLWMDNFDPSLEGADEFMEYLVDLGEVVEDQGPIFELVGGCAYPVKVVISRAKQRMYIYKNCRRKASIIWRVSTGKPKNCKKKDKKGRRYIGSCTTPTYSGKFSGRFEKRNYSSGKYGGGGCGKYGNMSYASFYKGGYAVHGTCSEGGLGRALSHGCTRLSRANARAFQNMVRKNGARRTKLIIK